MSHNVIAVDSRYKVGLESIAGAAITPGFLIEKSATKWIAHSVEGGDCDYVADFIPEESIDDAYADTEWMKILKVDAGDLVNCYLTTSQTITEGDKITSNGDGYVKEASTGSFDVGGASDYLTIVPADDQFVAVALIDPSATTQSLAVTIEGSYVNVSLATDGGGTITSTPELIETAIQAATGYSSLISSISTTGTSAVDADTGAGKPEKVFGLAEEDVTTTGTAARLLVRKGA